MNVEMRIGSLLIDPNTGLPIVVLVEQEGKRAVPIVIGMAEAESIALALQGTDLPRPRTHDLLEKVIAALGGELERIIVNDLRESTFYALLEIRCGDEVFEIDSRPSDAMALACRTGAPIFVATTVIDQARIRTPDEPESATTLQQGPPKPTHKPIEISPDSTVEELQELLKELGPDDFGKYKM